MDIAAAKSLIPGNNNEKDTNDNLAVSKPNTPETNDEQQQSPIENCSESD